MSLRNNFIKAGSVFVLMTAVISGCASTSVTRLGRHFAAKPKGCNIEIFAEAPTDRKYTEVCLLNARGSQALFQSKDVEALFPDMQEKACECGADAIVLKNSRAGGYNAWGPADRAEATASAIKFVK